MSAQRAYIAEVGGVMRQAVRVDGETRILPRRSRRFAVRIEVSAEFSAMPECRPHVERIAERDLSEAVGPRGGRYTPVLPVEVDGPFPQYADHDVYIARRWMRYDPKRGRNRR